LIFNGLSEFVDSVVAKLIWMRNLFTRRQRWERVFIQTTKRPRSLVPVARL